MNKALIFILPLLVFSLSPALVFCQKRVITLEPVEQIDANLKQDYAYAAFVANSDHLVWYELYTNTLFIYSLKNKRLKKISIQKGRGPHEILQLTDLAVSNEDIIYLLDYYNIKLIRIKPNGDYLKDVAFEEVHPFRITFKKHDLVMMDPLSQTALFYLFKRNSEIPIELNVSPVKQGLKGFFSKEGYICFNNGFLTYVTKYYPYLYIFNLETNQLAKKIKFDESAVIETEPRKAKNGAMIMAPPSKVDILSHDVAYIPHLKNYILLLAEGKTDNRDYSLSKLWVYNWEKEKFTDTLDLGVKAAEIAVNDKFLFVYSSDKNKIYKYKIIIKQE